MTVRFGRRRLLKGAAGLTLMLPWLRALDARAADVWPRRLLVFFHPNGVLPQAWFPTPGQDESSFTLSPSLSVLEPFRRQLLILEGLDLKCASAGPGEPHQQGMGAVLTGRPLLEGSMMGSDGTLAGWASGISLDQRIAQEVGIGTALGSLLLGVRSGGGDVLHHLSYAGANQPVPVIDDPRLAFDQLFSTFSFTPDPAQEQLRQRRASVLDAVRAQIGAAQKRLSAAERGQLEEHLAMVRDLERRLTASVSGDSCSKPAQPPSLDADSAEAMPQIARLQIDLMVTALACDLTRVGCLQFSQAENGIAFPWLDSPMNGHDLSHLGNSDPTREQLGWRDRWYAEQFAYLLERLRSVPEGGGTLLDHTLVFWVNEVAVGNTHSSANMPFVLAGGGAGFRMGRHVRFPSRSHSDLLLSILHGMGVRDTTFGDPRFVSGELPGLY